jgi:hypothetical protein
MTTFRNGKIDRFVGLNRIRRVCNHLRAFGLEQAPLVNARASENKILGKNRSFFGRFPSEELADRSRHCPIGPVPSVAVDAGLRGPSSWHVAGGVALPVEPVDQGRHLHQWAGILSQPLMLACAASSLPSCRRGRASSELTDTARIAPMGRCSWARLSSACAASPLSLISRRRGRACTFYPSRRTVPSGRRFFTGARPARPRFTSLSIRWRGRAC